MKPLTKPNTKTQRLQTYNSFKLGSNTAIKANPQKSQSKFELPMLNNRSSSKPSIGFSGSNRKVNEPQMSTCKNMMPNMQQTQSHNFLPAKQVVNGAIQTLTVNANNSGTLSASKQNNGNLCVNKAQQMSSVARLYQSQQPGSKLENNSSGMCTSSHGGSANVAAPKISNNKSPGKTFKRVGS